MRRPWLRALNIAVTLVLAVIWWNTYRPQMLGGPADYGLVTGASMEPTLHDGDLAITRERDSYLEGDVIAFQVPDGYPDAGLRVIHRIVGGSAEAGYLTRGDNRTDVDPWHIPRAEVIGSVSLRVPYAGSLFAVLREPPVFVWFIGSILLIAIWRFDRRRRRAALPA